MTITKHKVVENGEILSINDNEVMIAGWRSASPCLFSFGARFSDYVDLFDFYKCRKLTWLTNIPEDATLDITSIRDYSVIEAMNLRIHCPTQFIFERPPLNTMQFSSFVELEISGATPSGFPSPAAFPALKVLTVHANKSTFDWAACESVVDLILRDFNEADLQRMTRLVNLKRLCLVGGTYGSLKGLEALQTLETLRIVQPKRVVEMDSIKHAKCLTGFMFEASKKITDWGVLGGALQLRYLSLDTCQSLSFIGKLPLLEFLYCGKVLDKDRTPEMEHSRLQAAFLEQQLLREQGKQSVDLPFYKNLI